MTALLTALLTTLTSSFTSAFSTAFIERKEGVAEKRTQLRHLLESAYSLDNELRSNMTRRWSIALTKDSSERKGYSLFEDQRFEAAMASKPEALTKLRAMGTVHFPELDKEIQKVVNAYLNAERKTGECIFEAILREKKKKRPELVKGKDLLPSPQCAIDAVTKIAEVEVFVQELANAARLRLRVFFYDPEIMNK